MKRWILYVAGMMAAGFVLAVVLGNGSWRPSPAADVGAAAAKDKPAMAGGANPPAQAAATANAPAQQAAQAQAPVRAGKAPEASAGSAAPVSRQPAAAAPEYPPAELAAACGRKAEEIRRQYGDKLNVAAHPPFVIAGDMNVSQLESYAKASVVRPARAMWAAYFDKKPDQVITIFLFAGQDNYKLHARKDYPDGDSPYYGYYSPAGRTMVMNINTGTGTLVHELTHALVVYDFPNLPTWFNEGLASLHEQCNVEEDGITGLPNWRLPGLQAAISGGKLRPLAELVTKRDFYGPAQGVNYAQARYFVMYMQHKGLLREFYRHFRGHADGDAADVRAIEHVFGLKIAQIEPAFIAWVKTLKFER
jgi:hypothetical protein